MSWQDKARELPDCSGVYLMKDASGTIIYVGKANSLRQRVRSYIHGTGGQPPKVQAMLRHIADLDYIVTATPIEALVLECNLIKSYRPRYNIDLKDDKAYPYLKVTVEEEFPRLVITRRRGNDRSRYFGPYTNAGALKHSLRLVRRAFPLRSCKKTNWGPGHRPCLNAHMKLCLAPCGSGIDKSAYSHMVEDLIAFLEGRGTSLVRSLRRRMEEASLEQRFEEAARIRDQWQALEQVLAHRKLPFGGKGDHDVLGMARSSGEACIQVFTVRQGVVTGRESVFLEVGDSLPGEILGAFLQQYYNEWRAIPGKLLLPVQIEDGELIRQWLSQIRGRRVLLLVPSRGQKKEMVNRANDNARQMLELKQRRREQQAARLKVLQRELNLPDLPRRIEGYDISHLRGDAAVGSMVVFVNGRPQTSQYRRFRLKEAGRVDDYAALREVLRRRLKRSQEGDRRFSPLPDLILVDGGKGQADAARRVMDEFDLSRLPVLGLAKEEEILYFPQGGAVRLSHDNLALQLLQELRDESHRFAQAYHHNLRSKDSRQSLLDQIPGIGPKRRQSLLAAFGSVSSIRSASAEDIASLGGISRDLAIRVKSYLEQT